MKKLIMFIKRKPGTTFEQFKHHYESNHVALALKLIPQIAEYSRNYVRHGESYKPAHLANVNKQVEADFDVLTEISFKTEVDYQKMVDTLADPKQGNQLAEDEETFVDRSAIVMYFVDERRTPPELLHRD
jgi:EthD domain